MESKSDELAAARTQFDDASALDECAQAKIQASFSANTFWPYTWSNV